MLDPKITVLLTTYNRANYLKLAIESVLNQDFRRFELLIADDASVDNTEDVVKSFNDKRIVYLKSKKNLGFPGNFRNAVKRSRGKYIFLLSDDDLILKKDTLAAIFSAMERVRAGFGQTGLIFYDDDMRRPCFIPPPSVNRTFFVPPSNDILLKTANWHLGFASGNIYRRDFIDRKDIIDDVWFSHVKPALRIMRKFGAAYVGDHFILARISKSGNVSYLNIDVNKKFHMRTLFMLYREFDKSPTRFETFKKMHFDGIVHTFPGIKYYTSNKNITDIAREMIEIDKSYKYSPLFWLSFLSALITPKFILAGIRKIKLNIENIRLQKFLMKINFQKYMDQLIFK